MKIKCIANASHAPEPREVLKVLTIIVVLLLLLLLAQGSVWLNKYWSCRVIDGRELSHQRDAGKGREVWEKWELTSGLPGTTQHAAAGPDSACSSDGFRVPPEDPAPEGPRQLPPDLPGLLFLSGRPSG